MRILHLTTGLSTQSAAYRLHKGLLKHGVESFVYTGLKSLDEKEIIFERSDLKLKITAKAERLLLNLYPNRDNKPWNIGFFNNCVDRIIEEINPDIIHLHWINQFVSIKHIAKFNRPIVWTMHDSWAFTGGCHIPFPCEKFKEHCGICPQLSSTREHDLSNVIFNLKQKNWSKANIHIIGPSSWMCKSVAASRIFTGFPVVNIPNCIDTDFFTPKDKISARQKLGLPLDKKIILFGANNATNDRNKGYDLLLEAFSIIREESDDIELVVFGSNEKKWNNYLKIREMGFISDPDTFPLLYSAVDVLVNASRSENFSNIILESLSCGTPVVAFDIGGNSDLISNEFCGRLVSAFNPKEFASKITSLLLIQPATHSVRENIEKYNDINISLMHIGYYSSLFTL